MATHALYHPILQHYKNTVWTLHVHVVLQLPTLCVPLLFSGPHFLSTIIWIPSMKVRVNFIFQTRSVFNILKVWYRSTKTHKNVTYYDNFVSASYYMRSTNSTSKFVHYTLNQLYIYTPNHPIPQINPRLSYVELKVVYKPIVWLSH